MHQPGRADQDQHAVPEARYASDGPKPTRRSLASACEISEATDAEGAGESGRAANFGWQKPSTAARRFSRRAANRRRQSPASTATKRKTARSPLPFPNRSCHAEVRIRSFADRSPDQGRIAAPPTTAPAWKTAPRRLMGIGSIIQEAQLAGLVVAQDVLAFVRSSDADAAREQRRRRRSERPDDRVGDRSGGVTVPFELTSSK